MNTNQKTTQYLSAKIRQACMENSENKVSMKDRYLEALKTFDDWATVSEWAIRFAELYPDLLEKANKEAAAQKNETTGLREIAARMSSRVFGGGFGEHIQVDESERPKKVRYVSQEEAKKIIQKEREEDLAPLNRESRIKIDEEKLTTKEKYRLSEMKIIIGQLKSFFNLDFEFEHAKAILNATDPGRHHPDNIQILLKSHNRLKNSDNWERFSLEEQIEYIEAVVKVQKIVSAKMKVDIEEEVINSIIEKLKAVY
jgi:hypothetical protein